VAFSVDNTNDENTTIMPERFDGQHWFPRNRWTRGDNPVRKRHYHRSMHTKGEIIGGTAVL
jgi:hypothetical protein